MKIRKSMESMNKSIEFTHLFVGNRGCMALCGEIPSIGCE